MTTEEIKDKLIENFPQFDTALIDAISERALAKELEEGEVLMRTGQYFKSTILVIDGRVKLYREGENGEEFFVYYLNSGNACALSMVCASQQRTSEVMARVIQKATILMLPIEEMDNMMLEHKSWYYFVVETYRSRFEELLQAIDAIAFKSMDQRLAFYLEKQQKNMGSTSIFTTHQQIANDLNSSREVISRLLKKMEQAGMIALHRNQIEILWL